jgi:hypothetical protein
VQAAWVRGIKVGTASRWCPPSWATTTAPSRSTSGVARYRDHAAFGCILTRKRARHAQQQNDVQVTLALEHLSTGPHGACRGAAARAGWVWVVAVSSPHVQSHGKCALCVYVRYDRGGSRWCAFFKPGRAVRGRDVGCWVDCTYGEIARQPSLQSSCWSKGGI